MLRSLRDQASGAALHYLADSANAPYGERDEAHVLERSMRIAEHLVEQGAQVLVVACNTATAAAVAHLRAAWPQLPIVGVEPGLKPALALTRNGRVGVMATRTTLSSEKFQRLLQAHADAGSIQLRACDGLAAAIERGDPNDSELLSLIETHCKPLREADVDTVVLGCTHYAFVQEQIQAALGSHVRLIDTADAVARRACELVGHAPREDRTSNGASATVLETTGEPDQLLRIARRWLSFDFQIGATPARL